MTYGVCTTHVAGLRVRVRVSTSHESYRLSDTWGGLKKVNEDTDEACKKGLEWLRRTKEGSRIVMQGY